MIESEESFLTRLTEFMTLYPDILSLDDVQEILLSRLFNVKE